MRTFVVAGVVAGLATAGVARADDGDQRPGPTGMEMGVFLGGFVSNRDHQFYDEAQRQNRQELDRYSPELGVRFALFPFRLFGFEAEGSYIMASTKTTGDAASIFGVRGQAIFQWPGRFTPFVGAGIGLAHVTSDVMGDDTDYPIHVGAGVRFFVTKTLALRLDARVLRGPSSQDPVTLGASSGEVSFGVSFVPGAADRLPPPRANPDLDRDGVLGAEDHCPNEPGAIPDGCPVRDRDGDSVFDNVDKCPDQAETVNGFDDQDGCPDQVPDTDGDGFDDVADKCKDQSEDKDGFQDDDGCPDPDNDGDGQLDAVDRCPGQVGPVDNAGCPDNDGDRDGVVDRLDNCPTEAGTTANHGCTALQRVALSKDHLELTGTVAFAKGSAKLPASSHALLDNVARVINAHPELLKIRVESHAAASLGQRRADAVVAYLVKKGVAAVRLEAAGRAEDGATVELTILAQ